jgi:CelD/BcsL family acetyltransferase involved in cellulose biosynthesis
MVARAISFDDIPRDVWDRLFAVTSAATPFSEWRMHRAWWDAYAPTAHQQYLVCLATGASDAIGAPATTDIRAIVPLMHRHEVEPEDAATRTALRRQHREGKRVSPDAKAIFFGASYHADYATLLADPADLDAVAEAVVEALAEPPDAEHGEQDWDVIDLRRLRDQDPTLPALEQAFRRRAARQSWQVHHEQEDVCPVLTFADADWEAYLGRLAKKARHEIRRKIRRAESEGELRFRFLPPTPETVESFIDLHQARWGADGLFPDTAGGARSRRFLHRMAELAADEAEQATIQFGQLSLGGRPVFATVGFDDGESCFFYNAGMDPDMRDISPGVTGTAAYLRDRLEAGRRRFDFLRGDEPYKYEWGAVDEPVHRLLITRDHDR